jgi:hypothetical protein
MTPINSRQRPTNRITSTDFKQVIADGFEVLVDAKPKYPAKPAIGLKVDPVNGESFIMPIEFKTARDLVALITQVLLAEAPELFRNL